MLKKHRGVTYGKSIRPVVFFACLLPSLLLCQSQNLPLDHWAYSFLDRLETRGLYLSEDFDTFPYSREAIAEMILQVDEKVSRNPDLLSNVEWGLFQRLKGEFYEELQEADPQINISEQEYEPHLFTWRNEDIDVRGDGLLGHQQKFESNREVDITIPKSVSHVGLQLRVDMKKSFAIFAEERTFFLGDTDSLLNNVFNPSLGLPVTEEALVDVAVTDNASGYIVVRLPWLDIEAGRDLIEWGPGFRGNLILSRNSNYYDLFKFTFRYQKFKWESFHAFLNSDRTKYLAGHRLEIRPLKRLQIGVSETVVYGGRSVEFLYFNPFVPILVAERHIGNMDNNMISFDGTIFLNNLKIYSEVLLDDFSFAKDIFGNFVNKWGVMLGSYWVDPFGIKDTDFRFELVRIQPFVYSHIFPINTYSNYNNTMGHWLGPDADDWYFEVGHWLHRNLRIGISWEQRRRGDNDITEGTRPEDNQIHFLDGTIERNRFYGLSAQWQVRRDIFFGLAYNFIQSKNLRRMAEVDQDNHRVFLTFSLNH